jgi:hypothetical protein
MKYKFTGATDAQVNWGGNDDPREVMKVGDIVTLNGDPEVHLWHTKMSFKEHPGKKFNSVSFEKVEYNK